jgi:hypothetical protein
MVPPLSPHVYPPDFEGFATVEDLRISLTAPVTAGITMMTPLIKTPGF